MFFLFFLNFNVLGQQQHIPPTKALWSYAELRDHLSIGTHSTHGRRISGRGFLCIRGTT